MHCQMQTVVCWEYFKINQIQLAVLFVNKNIVLFFYVRWCLLCIYSIFRVRSHREGDREPILAALICRTFRDHTIVFVQTKKQAHTIHIQLGLLGVKVTYFSSSLLWEENRSYEINFICFESSWLIKICNSLLYNPGFISSHFAWSRCENNNNNNKSEAKRWVLLIGKPNFSII